MKKELTSKVLDDAYNALVKGGAKKFEDTEFWWLIEEQRWATREEVEQGHIIKDSP